jgi:hypothetical protein
MTPVALRQADMVTVSMIAAVAVEVMAVTTRTVIVDLAMIVVTEATDGGTVMTDTPLAESIDMPDVMIAMAVETNAAVEVEDIRIAMTEVVIATVDAHLEMLLLLPPMVTKLLAESQGSHMEVETMMRDTPAEVIDC